MSDDSSGTGSTGDWSFVKADETQSDIEVISNPSTAPTDTAMVLQDQRPLLYSEILTSDPPALPEESDIEFVAEELDSPQLEYDDEYLVDQLMHDEHLAQDRFLQESSASSSPEDEVEEERVSDEEEEVEESESETLLLPPDMPQPMSEEECESREQEVVLEVNLTLLSFTLIVGVSGMSGFLLGGIYSAVLTNNIQHETSPAAYPGILPSFLYSDEMPPATCPALDSCQSRVYRVEENMKQLKETLSHDISACHEKLRSVHTQNAALHHTTTATAAHCTSSRAEVAELRAKTTALLSEIETQRAEMEELKHTRDGEAAQSLIQIATLAQSLDNTKGELEEARRAVTVLDNLNNDCRTAQNSALARTSIEEQNFWKNLYKQAILDLETAERKVGGLEKALRSEMRDLEEAQDSIRAAKSSFLKEKNAKGYYKNLSEQYAAIIAGLEKKQDEVRGRSHTLSERIAALRADNAVLEKNLESCSESAARSEEKARAAVNSKQYVESLLINKISHNREDYQVLKRLYFSQGQELAELESQRSTLEETLIRKINSKKQKVLSVKEAAGSEKEAAEEELARSQALVASLTEQMEAVEAYVAQIEGRLGELREEVVMRDAIQREYIASRERAIARCAANTTRDNGMVEQLREVAGRAEHWKQSARYSEHRREELEGQLGKCRSSKVTAVEEYKKTTDLLMDLLQDIATKPQCELSDSPTAPLEVPRSLMFASPARHFFELVTSSSSSLTNTSSDDQVLRAMRSKKNSSTGDNFSLLQQLYNSSDDLDLELCYPSMRPLFPSVAESTLAGVVNMTQRPDKAGHKMTSALEKYWGGVDKVYSKLSRKIRQPQGPKRRDSDDWERKGEFTGPRRNGMWERREGWKGDFDCDLFDCRSYHHFGFELCGC